MFVFAIPWVVSALTTTAAATTAAATTITVTEGALLTGAAVGYIAAKNVTNDKK